MNRAFFLEKSFFLAAAASVLATVAIFVFMVFLGLPILTGGNVMGLLTGGWSPDHGMYGIKPMILGSLIISCLSLIIAFPLSLGCSVLIAVLSPGWISRILQKTVRGITGIPTVVYGFVGIFLLVPVVRNFFTYGSGMSILTASILLAILITPTMILIFVDSFERVPRSYLQAVDALGGSRVQKFFHILLPCARRGILTGTLLAFGRAMGDTMISLMVSGNSVGLPGSILDSSRTLTAHIGMVIAADFDSLEFRALFGCALILYLLTAAVAILVRSLSRSTRKQA